MAVGLVDYNTMVSIGDAIRLKLDTDETYAPYEMADAIKSIQNEGGGGTGFGNEYVVAALPFANYGGDGKEPFVFNNYIVEFLITNELPDDCVWSKRCEWEGMSVGNVTAFVNGWDPNRRYPEEFPNGQPGYIYNYPYYFGLYLEGGDENSAVSILDMANLFTYSYNIETPFPVGNYTISMENTYYDCYNMKGPATCGPNVVQMYNTYSYCQNLTGSPVCGPKVMNFSQAYYSDLSLTGRAVCGENVVTAASAYYQCRNLIGDAPCGNNVVNAYMMYYGCSNLSGTGYIGRKLLNGYQMFYGTQIRNFVYADGIVKHPNGVFYGCQPNAEYLVLPESMIFINGLFNGVQSVKEPYDHNNVLIASYAYAGCNYLTSFKCSDSIINADYMYAASYYSPSTEGMIPVVGNNVVCMNYMYNGQKNMVGEPVCGPHTQYMVYTYRNCTNLTGSPVFPENLGIGNYNSLPFNWFELKETYKQYVNDYEWGIGYLENTWKENGEPAWGHPANTGVQGTYYGCTNLTGNPVLPSAVWNAQETYVNCNNLTGNPVSTPNLRQAYNLYHGCTNLTGSVNMGANIMNMNNTFRNCSNISGIYIPTNNYEITSQNMSNAFTRLIWDTRLNVIVGNRDVFNLFRSSAGSIFGCPMTAEMASSDIIEICGEYLTAVRYAYNSARNYYLYCTE